MYVDNGSAFVDAWLLRACAKLGMSLVHSQPGRPQGRGKIERFFRTVREQFLVEVTDTSSEDLAAAGVDHGAALLELNRLFIAWVETEYHRRTHSETGQSPLARWEAGWDRLGRTPAMPTADDLTEAFLWSELRTVTKTATVSLHANTYQVDPGLVGRRVELVFSPFDLETVEVRYRDKSYGKALPHIISRHTHPKAKPETSQPAPATIDWDRLPVVDRGRPPPADPPQTNASDITPSTAHSMTARSPASYPSMTFWPRRTGDPEGEVSA